METLISYQSGRVDLLATSGEVRWVAEWEPPNYKWALRIADVDRDGREEIVHAGEGELIVRSGVAEVLGRLPLPGGGYVNRVELLDGFGEPPRDVLLVGHEVAPGPRGAQNHHLVELDGPTIGARVEWEDVERFREGWVALAFDDAPELALARVDQLVEQAPIAGISATWLRLRVFDRGSRLVYDEILEPPGKPTSGSPGALLFLPAAEGRAARLLVAYAASVWCYAPRASSRQ
jgi:hypothetical protein